MSRVGIVLGQCLVACIHEVPATGSPRRLRNTLIPNQSRPFQPRSLSTICRGKWRQISVPSPADNSTHAERGNHHRMIQQSQKYFFQFFPNRKQCQSHLVNRPLLDAQLMIENNRLRIPESLCKQLLTRQSLHQLRVVRTNRSTPVGIVETVRQPSMALHADILQLVDSPIDQRSTRLLQGPTCSSDSTSGKSATGRLNCLVMVSHAHCMQSLGT